jgi:hypothetical protein
MPVKFLCETASGLLGTGKDSTEFVLEQFSELCSVKIELSRLTSAARRVPIHRTEMKLALAALFLGINDQFHAAVALFAFLGGV